MSKLLPTPTMEPYNAPGSFSPTTSASASLLALEPSLSRVWSFLGHIQRKTLSDLLWHENAVESPSPQSPETDSPSSPLSIKSSLSSIPSISRTSSSVSDSDIGLIPSSAAQSKAPSPNAEGRSNYKLHPILAACEKMSKVSNRTICVTCKKPGYDYPRCGKCGEMWCSRACRLRDGAKRHVCSTRRSTI